MTDNTFAGSQRALELIEKLTALEEAGAIRPAEREALQKLRGERQRYETNVGETNAAYRGVAAGASLGARDEVTGAISALTGGDYATARDEVRNADMKARTAFPDQFNAGRTAGTGMTALLPGIGGMQAARGMGILGQMGVGATVGGLTAGTQGFMEGMGGFGPRMRNARDPAAIGAGFGAGGPLASRTVGGIARLAQRAQSAIPGVSARATTALQRPIERSLQSGQDIQAYLDELGPEAMLVDGSQSLRRTGQGLAAMPGAGGETLGAALNQRAAGASDRVRNVMDANLGGPDEAFLARRAQAAERSSKLGPMYDAALEYAEPMDVDGVADVLRSGQRDAASRVSGRLKSLERDLGIKLDDEGKAVLPEDVSALKLHNMRSDLSDDIEEARRAGRGKFVTAMRPVLEALDAKLDEIPGYAAARTGYANNKAIEDAIEAGRGVFTGGPTSAMSPKQLQEEIANLSPAQRDAFRKGAREWVSALMGTSRNDAARAWGEFEKGWNEEKLRVLLGDEFAGPIIQRLKAEAAFSRTRGEVLQGSQTQMRAEAANDLADLRPPDGGQRPSVIGRAYNAVNDAGNSLVDKILYAGRQDVNAQVGNLMSLQGDARDALLQGLLREVARRNSATTTQRILAPSLDAATRSAGAPLATIYQN